MAVDKEKLHEFIEDMKRKIHQADSFNSREPVPRPYKDLEFAMMMHNIHKLQMVGVGVNDNYSQELKPNITGKSHYSAKSLQTLKPITLKQMEVPKIHFDRFLACRISSDVYDAAGLNCIVTDSTNDDVELLTLFNFHTESTKYLLEEGTILLIKEPNLQKYDCRDEKHNFIRVDSPSDVIFVHETELKLLTHANALCWYKPETCTAEELKTNGNDMFNKGNYDAALEFYKRALSTNPESEVAIVIHSDMAITLIKLNRFYEAYQEAEISLRGDKIDRHEVLFRLAKSSYGMRNWANAEKWFKQMFNEFPASKKAKNGLADVESRLKEATTGRYDMLKLFELAKNGHTDMDVADYVGPIKVVDFKRKGKGLIATKDVPKGTLLSATKAYVYCAKKVEMDSHYTCYNVIIDEVFTRTESRCIVETIQKLKRNPQTAKQVYELYAGRGIDRSKKVTEGVIDPGRIERICSCNQFTCESIVSMVGQQIVGVEKLYEDGTGLWILPSYANHSCLASAERNFYGDMFFLTAVKDLKEGEEITLSYFTPDKPYSERQHFLKKWKFNCDCRLCELDRSEVEEEKKREAILKALKEINDEAFSNPQKLLVQLKEMLKEMRRTYHGRKEFHVHLIEILMELGSVYKKLGRINEAIEAYNEISVICSQLNMSAMNMYENMHNLYMLGFHPPKRCEAKRIETRAFQDAKLHFAVYDLKMFKRLFPEFAGN